MKIKQLSTKLFGHRSKELSQRLLHFTEGREDIDGGQFSNFIEGFHIKPSEIYKEREKYRNSEVTDIWWEGYLKLLQSPDEVKSLFPDIAPYKVPLLTSKSISILQEEKEKNSRDSEKEQLQQLLQEKESLKRELDTLLGEKSTLQGSLSNCNAKVSELEVHIQRFRSTELQDKALIDELRSDSEKYYQLVKTIEEEREMSIPLRVVRWFSSPTCLLLIQLLVMYSSSLVAYVEMKGLHKPEYVAWPLAILFGVVLTIISFNRVGWGVVLFFVLYELINGLLYFNALSSFRVDELFSYFRILQAGFLPILTMVMVSMVKKKF